LLSIGLLGVAGMQTTAISGNRSSRDVTVAVQVAEEIIDRIRVNGGNSPEIYNNINTGGSCSTFAEPAKGDCLQWQERLQATNLIGIAGVIDVTANDPMPNAARVNVTITWGAGGSHNVTLSTLLETWGT
jgi:Tfp pilus assembly protein PilV